MLSAETFLIVICVYPDIRDIVIKHLSNFINYTGRQLRRYLGRRNQPPHSFDFAFVYQGDGFQFLGILLGYRHNAASERGVSSLLNLQVQGVRSSELVQKMQHDGFERID